VHVREGNGTEDHLAQMVGVHQCTAKDWSKFEKPSDRSRIVFEHLKE